MQQRPPLWPASPLAIPVQALKSSLTTLFFYCLCFDMHRFLAGLYVLRRIRMNGDEQNLPPPRIQDYTTHVLTCAYICHMCLAGGVQQHRPRSCIAMPTHRIMVNTCHAYTSANIVLYSVILAQCHQPRFTSIHPLCTVFLVSW